MDPDAVAAVEQRGLNGPGADRAGVHGKRPRIQLRARDARQPARRVQPERAVIILGRPVHAVAGQAVLRGQRVNPAVLDPAESAFGRGPDGAVRVQPQVADHASSQSFRDAVRRDDSPVLEIRQPGPVAESEPQAAAHGIGHHRHRRDLASQRGPRDPSGDASAGDMEQALVLTDPDVAGRVTRDGVDTARDAGDWVKRPLSRYAMPPRVDTQIARDRLRRATV